MMIVIYENGFLLEVLVYSGRTGHPLSPRRHRFCKSLQTTSHFCGSRQPPAMPCNGLTDPTTIDATSVQKLFSLSYSLSKKCRTETERKIRYTDEKTDSVTVEHVSACYCIDSAPLEHARQPL